jgi:hypothetical protein
MLAALPSPILSAIATRMSSTTTNTAVYKFNHTMFRIKDPKVSIPFYEKVLGMEVSPSLQTVARQDSGSQLTPG